MSWWTTDRKAYALRYLLSAGLSPYGAAGLVSRWAYVEAPDGPTSRGGYKGRAWGIAQWLGPRLPAINGNTSFDAQLAYVIQELNSTEWRAASVLRSANDIQSGAVGATMYERAGNYNIGRWAGTNQDDYTARTAQGMPGVLALMSAPAQALPSTSADVRLNPAIPAANTSFDFGFDESDPDSIAGIVATASTTGILLAIGATVLMVYLISNR